MTIFYITIFFLVLAPLVYLKAFNRQMRKLEAMRRHFARPCPPEVPLHQRAIDWLRLTRLAQRRHLSHE